jgi:hypothetical protein
VTAAKQWAARLRESALAEAVYGSSDATLCEELSLTECRELSAILDAADEMREALAAMCRTYGECVVPEKPCASLGIRYPQMMCEGCHGKAALAKFDAAAKA